MTLSHCIPELIGELWVPPSSREHPHLRGPWAPMPRVWAWVLKYSQGPYVSYFISNLGRLMQVRVGAFSLLQKFVQVSVRWQAGGRWVSRWGIPQYKVLVQ